MLRRGHPKRKDGLRSFIARRSFPALIALFIGILAVVSFAVGVGYRLTRATGEPESLLVWWHEAS